MLEALSESGAEPDSVQMIDSTIIRAHHLAADAKDRVVDIEQAESMEKALKQTNAKYKFVKLPKGSHYLDVGDNRLTYLKEAEAFLKSCLD